MRCFLCNDTYLNESLYDLLKLHEICRKCQLLYIYDKKNVKIGKSKLVIYYFKFYKSIIFYDYKVDRVKYYHFLLKKKRIVFDKISDVKIKNNITIIYQRNELYLILRYLKMNIFDYKCKIIMYEIM